MSNRKQKIRIAKRDNVIPVKRIHGKNKQAGRCHYCWNWFPLKKLTRDHVVPKSDGGKNNDANMVLACQFCNQYRVNGFLSRQVRNGKVPDLVRQWKNQIEHL